MLELIEKLLKTIKEQHRQIKDMVKDFVKPLQDWGKGE
jgi:hypothetical protein